MKKELKNQLELIGNLEKIGFARVESSYELIMKKGYSFKIYNDMDFFCYKNNEYVIGLQSLYENPTFEQILEAIKEHTWHDLTPKLTKRQEIDKNKSEAHRANDRISCLSRRTDRELKWALKRIDALEQGNQSQAQMIEDLQKSYPEPKSEPEKTEGFFKVGDPVVLSSIVCHYSQDIVDEHKKQTVFIVNGEEDGEYCLANKNGIEFGDDSVYYFSKRELQHAPKAFKVGDLVVLNPVIDFSINSIKLEAAAQTVFTVSGTNTNCFYLSKNGKPFFKDILFYQCELLNAPIKRIFETGNRVVVKPRNTYAFGCSDSKRNKAKCSTILIIQDICGNNSVAGGLEIETNDGRYTVGELQHAPKEAAKANSFSLEDYQNAYRCACDLLTLLDEKYYFGGVIPLESIEGVISQIDNVVAGLEKRKEAAKVLEFGGWAETLVQMDSIDIGQRVLIVSNPDVDGEFLCTSGIPKNSEHYDPEQLKAL
jgi:hypothetical protein